MLSNSQKFERYKSLLVEWNEKINLTAITDSHEIDVKHFQDSLSLLNTGFPSHAKIIDIGTGAGFPGIPLKIQRPDLRMTLVDSLLKRINFLELVIEELDLKEIQCRHIRSEEAGKSLEFRQKFDICTSRAVAKLNVLTELSFPLLKVGGYMLAMKSSKIDEEIEQTKPLIKLFGGDLKDTFSYNLELNDEKIERKIVIVQKIKDTPKSYPRNGKKLGMI